MAGVDVEADMFGLFVGEEQASLFPDEDRTQGQKFINYFYLYKDLIVFYSSELRMYSAETVKAIVGIENVLKKENYIIFLCCSHKVVIEEY